MKNFTYLVLITLVGMFVFGCEMEPTKPENKLEIDETVKKLAPLGWNANYIVTNSAEVADVTNQSQFFDDDGTDDIPGVGTLRKEAVRLFSAAKMHSEQYKHNLKKTLEDSLLFFQDNKVLGIRKALYYNKDNGMARYYEVKYKFAAWQNLTYDSTEVRADLNHTLEDSLDDVLLNLYQLQNFKETFFINRIESKLTVTDYEGKEVTGAELTKSTNYKSDWFLAKMVQNAKIFPNKSGELREDFEFKDGKTSYKIVKFFPDNTGEFEEKKRDGTLVSGKFDGMEDDNEGYFEEITDFPAGRYVDKIEKSAEISLAVPESILTINYVESITFSSGKTNTDSATIITQELDGVKNTKLDYYKHNGEHGSLDITENDDGSTLTGNWTTVEGFYIKLSAEYYIDGSGHIYFAVYNSETDFNNGADPILVADYYFSPDGSGNGTLSYQGESYEIKFEESGTAEVSLEGQSTTINLFQ